MRFCSLLFTDESVVARSLCDSGFAGDVCHTAAGNRLGVPDDRARRYRHARVRHAYDERPDAVREVRW